MAKKHRLRVGKVLTVGFVGAGDNPPAEVTFFKRRDMEDVDKDASTYGQERGGQMAEQDLGPMLYTLREAVCEALEEAGPDQNPADLIRTSLDQFMAEASSKIPTWVGEMQKAAMKTEGGVQFPASAYAYVPDPEKPSTWKLRLWEDTSKKVTARQVGMAVAALGKGFRGQRVQIPSADLPSVKKKVLAAWKSVAASDAQTPEVLKSHQESMMEKSPTLMAKFVNALKSIGATKDDVLGLDPEELAKGLDGAPPADEGSDMQKSAEVVALEKALEAANAKADDATQAVQKLRDERENEVFVAKAAKFQHIPNLTADDFGPIMRKISKALEPDEFAKVEEILKAADEASRDLYKEVGSSAADPASAEAEVQAKVADYQKDHPTASASQARGEVLKAHPQLLQKLMDEESTSRVKE